jgi:hypothetical protein
MTFQIPWRKAIAKVAFFFEKQKREEKMAAYIYEKMKV